METTKPKLTWKRVLLPMLGVVAFFAYLYLFNVDIPRIIAIVQGIDLSMYVSAIVVVTFETLFFALAWHFLITFLTVKLSIMRAFLYVWYGIYMDIIIPAESISGEITKVFLVTREQEGVSGKVVASLVVQRLMGMAINVASLLIGIGFLLTQEQVTATVIYLVTLLSILTTVFLLLVIIFCFKENWTKRIVEGTIRFLEFLSRGHWKLTKVKDDILKATETFHNSMKDYRHAPGRIGVALIFSILSWVFSFLVAYLVFLSMRFPVHWSIIVVTCSIIVAVQSMPIGVPFEAGLPEITMTLLFQWLVPGGMPLDIAATATILIRVVTVWFRFFIGFVAQQWLEIKTITSKKASQN